MSPSPAESPRTLFEKIWDAHVVRAEEGKPTILYIDLHLVHEVTSPQAFEGLRLAKRRVRRPERTVATPDHNVPTTDRSLPILDPIAKQQIDTLRANCAEFGIKLYDLSDPANPRYIGGYNPDAPDPAATVELGLTDRAGRLSHIEGGATRPGVRILAALGVAVWHGEFLQPRLVPPFTHGYLGVDLFFMLSGFIIAHVYWRDFLEPTRQTWFRFVALRLARLWPAHMAVIALFVAMMLARQRQ